MAQGKRAGSRRAARPTPTVDRGVLAYAGGITLCVIAWGYLVYAAIDFGSSARAGSASSWLLLLLAGVGAAACLFMGLMLVARLGVALGISRSPEEQEDAAQRPPGGRRAAR